MVLLAVRMDDCAEARAAMEAFMLRFTSEDGLVKNPFKGTVRLLTHENELRLVAVFDVLYPRVYWVSIPVGAAALIFSSVGLAIAASVFALIAILWEPSWYHFVLRRAARRSGYHGPFERATPEDAVRWVGGTE